MSQRIAICMGVNKHRNAPLINLRFARGDAESIASILANEDQGQFDKVLTVFDEQADKANVLGMLKGALLDSTLTKDDLILVFFSGHGALDNGENLFLVPHDIGFLGDNSVDPTTCIHIKDLEILLDNTHAGSVLIIMDACHSGASGKLLGRIKYSDSSNIVLIGAARYSESAWETSELEHGRFTQSLLNCVNERPSYGEWITLQQALSFIQIDMGRNGASQTAEVSSHAIDQNILLFKNPMYSLVSTELVEQAKELCELSNCVVVSTQPDQTFPNAFIMQEQRSFGRHDHTLVLCLDNTVIDINVSHISQINTLYRDLRTANQISSGLLITRNELPAILKHNLDQGVSNQTIDDLQRNLMSFERYLRQLIRDFMERDPDREGEPPLNDYYVELNAGEITALEELVQSTKKKLEDDKISLRTKDDGERLAILPQSLKGRIATFEAILSESNLEMGKIDAQRSPEVAQVLEQMYGETKPIAEMINQWLVEHSERVAIVLGGYGTGKTTFARKLACDLAKTYLASPNKRGLRIPILFPLRRFPKFASVDIEAAIIAYLKQECKVANPDFAAFNEMNKAGLFVLIFDGFDEMAVQASEEIIKRNFLEISQLAMAPNAKVIVTSRPEAFLSDREEIETILQHHDFLPENYPSVKRFRLHALSLKQIELFLQRRVPLIDVAAKSGKDWTYYRDQINNTMGLKELAARPVLLEMTIKTLPKANSRRWGGYSASTVRDLPYWRNHSATASEEARFPDY